MNDIIQLENLSTGYKTRDGDKTVSGGINISAEKGKLIFLTGPNGSGKTTLMKTITGHLKPVSGRIIIAGTETTALKRGDLSKKISVVLTEIPDPGFLTVYEVTALGRATHTGIRNRLLEQDRIKISESISLMGLSGIKNRLFNRISDGEKQKTMIARALSQDTEIICLDEPSSHLDFPSKIELVSYLKMITEEGGKTVIVSSHDLDIAINSGDIMWLLDKNGDITSGTPEDLALSGIIGRVFNRNNFRFSEENGEFIIENDSGRKITFEGEPVPLYWTEKGFRKVGGGDETDNSVKKVTIKIKNGKYVWVMNGKEFDTIEKAVSFYRESFL